MKLVNVGFGNMVNAQRVICVVSPDSAPVKRIVQHAKEENRLIDLTQGRKTMSVLFTDSRHVLLSYLRPERLQPRFDSSAASGDQGEEEE